MRCYLNVSLELSKARSMKFMVMQPMKLLDAVQNMLMN